MQIKIADISTQRIFLGWTGENKHVQFAYDFSDVFAEYPDAGVGLTIQPPTGDAYPHTITRDGTTVLWEILASDCAVVGDGVYQFTFTQGETVAKSLKGFYTVKESLTGSGEAPTPVQNWIADAEAALFALTGMTARAETLAPGSSATASIVTENGRKVIVIGIPTGLKGDKGDKGNTGETPNLTVGTVTTLPPGSDATVTISGTPENPILYFGIPQGLVGDKGDTGAKGDKGDTGATPDFSIGTVSTLAPDASATASITGTDENPILNLGIPKGVQGQKGDKGDAFTYADFTEEQKTELIQGPIKAAQDKAVDSVEDAGAVQVQAVEDKGAEVLDSIPQDYTDLVNEVSSLNSALNDIGDDVDALKVDKADVIISSASDSIASFPDGADGMPVKELTVGIEPVQDLHGYDHPWPAGSGKNKLNIDAIQGNSRIVINNGVMTVTTTEQRDNETTAIPFSAFANLVVGETYILTFDTTYTGGQYIYLRGTSEIWNIGNSKTITQAMLDGFVSFYAGIGKTATITNLMIRLASETDATFAPYSNNCPISGWTGTNVFGTGGNLFDNVWELGSISNTTGENVSGNSSVRCKNYVPVKNGSTIYFGWDTTATGSVYMLITSYKADKSFCRYIRAQVNPLSLQLQDDDYYIRFYLYNRTDPLVNPYIVPGITASAYTPYQGASIPVEFPSEAGTVYGGSLTVFEDGTGELTVGWASRTFNGNDTLQGSYNDTEATNRYVWIDAFSEQSYTTINKNNMVCNLLKVVAAGVWSPPNNHKWECTINSGTQFHMCFGNNELGIASDDSTSARNEKINAWLSENPVHLCYKLATTTTFTLTALEVLETLKGVNNIWADTGAVEVTYRADTKLYIDNRITQAIAAALNA